MREAATEASRTTTTIPNADADWDFMHIVRIGRE